MVGREDIVETMNIINLDRLRPDPEGSQVAVSQAPTIARSLRLTAQQQNIIATGTELYLGLLQTVMQERQQLQVQFSAPAVLAQQQQQQAPSQGPSVSSGGTDTSDSSVPDSFTSRRAHLEAEEMRMARLQLLMRKE
jgi:D-serine deaminase-like pyridoxal phosphate-dependent protein